MRGNGQSTAELSRIKQDSAVRSSIEEYWSALNSNKPLGSYIHMFTFFWVHMQAQRWTLNSDKRCRYDFSWSSSGNFCWWIFFRSLLILLRAEYLQLSNRLKNKSENISTVEQITNNWYCYWLPITHVGRSVIVCFARFL